MAKRKTPPIETKFFAAQVLIIFESANAEAAATWAAGKARELSDLSKEQAGVVSMIDVTEGVLQSRRKKAKKVVNISDFRPKGYETDPGPLEGVY